MVKYAVFAFYLVVLFAIGLAASRKVKNIKDYYVGGKTLGHWVVAFSARATGESAWLLLGLTGMGALIGVKAFWVVLGEVLGVAICWLFMVQPFKRLTDKYDAMTVTDYICARFDDQNNWLRKISSFVLSVFVIIYVSAQIDATGKAFESFFEWNYYVGILVGMAVVSFYTFSGGFLAVAWSDVFQGLLMAIGLIILPVFAFMNFSSSGAGLFSSLAAVDTSLVSVWGEGGMSLMNVMSVIGLLSVGLGFLGSPQVFVRFISVRDTKELKKGTPVAIIYTLVTDSAAVMIGIIGRVVLAPEGDPLVVLGQGGQDVLPLLVNETFSAVVVGLFIAAVLSAIMSTIDSLLVVASSAVTRDYYQKVLRPDADSSGMEKLSRKVTLTMAFLALAVALAVALLSPQRTIYWFVIFGWSGIAASFCPMIILSLLWRRYNLQGAITSMVSGFICIPLFEFVFTTLPTVGPYFEKLGEMTPAFVVSFIVGIAVTLLTSSEKPSDRNQAV